MNMNFLILSFIIGLVLYQGLSIISLKHHTKETERKVSLILKKLNEDDIY